MAMVASSNVWLFRDVARKNISTSREITIAEALPRRLQTQFFGELRSTKKLILIKCKESYKRKVDKSPLIKSVRKDGEFDPSSIEKPPYHVYFDSTSGQLEPASGARASLPGKEYWPEGTADRVRAARAPEPVGKSEGKSSYGKNPGSRRKKYKANVSGSEISEAGSNCSNDLDFINESDNNDDFPVSEISDSDGAMDEPKEPSNEYVIYQAEEENENLSPYELDKKMGRPHSFIDPSKVRPMEEPRSSEDLWWNWRKPEEGQWSRWQRRRPDVDTVFAKAMNETGQIKLYGDHPTITETALARARKHIFKDERNWLRNRQFADLRTRAAYTTGYPVTISYSHKVTMTTFTVADAR